MNLSMTGFVLEEVDAFSEILRPRYTWSYVWTVRLPVEVDPFPSPGLRIGADSPLARRRARLHIMCVSLSSVPRPPECRLDAPRAVHV